MHIDPNLKIPLYFQMKEELLGQHPKYFEKYGIKPVFKAGIHYGKVTTGEIGTLKKDIVEVVNENLEEKVSNVIEPSASKQIVEQVNERTAFDKSHMDRLLKKHGAARVSETGKAALKKALEETAEELSRKAIKFANHAGRKTIKAVDVQLAKK